MDYETIINCFVAVFEHYKNDDERRVFVIYEETNDFPDLIEFLNTCVNSNQWHISFNGLNFDAQITQWMLVNQIRLLKLSPGELIKEIYSKAQDIIDRSDRGEFQQFRPDQIKIRQIDLFKMNHWDNKAKMSSLKWIQYSMDWDNVEEMPHPYYAPVTSDDVFQKIVTYCINDVSSTKKILDHSKEQIKLRQTLTKEYNIDLYSASEPRISKELFLHFLSEKMKCDKSYIKQLRTPRNYIILAECILPYIQFKTQAFNDVLNYFRTKVITSTKDGFKYTVSYKGMKTDYGLGGIHGARDAGVYEAKPGWTIMTSDVTSFYPNLAIRNGFHPEHLPKNEFCELYEWFFEERKKIPKTDPKNYVFKIILNSTYGLTGDENSFLYDPKMTMQITINGQLSLSMLYEMICEEIPEAIPLMQNTDGLETMIPTSKVQKYHEICNRWCLMTKLELEHDEYKKMVIRDVNNYIAINIKDKVKCKGAFEWEDLAKKKVATFHKNKSFLIIPKAIYAYFVHGTLPEQFLATNKEVFDYCAGVKSKGEWKLYSLSVENSMFQKTQLQKIVRYYISNKGIKIVKAHPDGREIQVESGQWLQTVVNKVNTPVPITDYDINYKYYLEEIWKQIDQIQTIKHNESVQLSLF